MWGLREEEEQSWKLSLWILFHQGSNHLEKVKSGDVLRSGFIDVYSNIETR